MAISRTLAKDRDRHPLKAPCLHLSQIGTSIVKKLKERALSLPGKLPAPSILREFCFEIWERESAPADYCLIRRLSMDASCPSLPPKILVRNETDVELRPNAQTTAFMAAHGCHLSTGCLYVLLVIIEVFFLAVHESVIARTVLYKVSIAIVSRSFYEKRSPPASTHLDQSWVA
jgi:hypothetical protein